ncbi:Lrp/AsnC family transcriptional regulator [Bacillus massiliglaciei]|uniref:Lrp/AsnC family transcriptional regulator n=1 Tax=Bacillus massiliglaciei TaxID=1816693 RepID=UPI000A8A420F|nr:Lrp/AsnC family transcriptional regulator [Bacillus massiliglaciei]
MKLDDKDREILNELGRDGRLSMRELGKKVGMSAPAVTERVRQMESFGVITGYHAAINRKKIGFPIDCIMEATVKNGEYERFKTYISKRPEVEHCWRIAGRACFMLKMHAESLEKVEEFISQTIPYAQTVTHIVLSEVDMNQDKY